MAAKKPVRSRAIVRSAASPKRSVRAKAARGKTLASAKAKKAGATRSQSSKGRSSKTKPNARRPTKAAKGKAAAKSKVTRNAQGRAKPPVMTKSKSSASSKGKGKPVKAAKAPKILKAVTKPKPAPGRKAPAVKSIKKPAARPPSGNAGREAALTGQAGTTPLARSSGKLALPRKGSDGKAYTRLEHIDDETLNQIIAKLEEMRAESLKSVNMKMADGSPATDESEVGDDMDLASQDRDREFNLLMHERHLRRLQQIDEAFERIREGTYGLCEGTDEPINPKRLLIMPLARFSIEYQQEQEKMLGRTPEEFYFEEEAAIENEEE